MKSPLDQTPYEVLECAPGATAEALAKAYAKAKETYGPGSLATYALAEPGEAEAVVKRVEEAYAVLSDPEKRRAYDVEHGWSPPPAAPEAPAPPASIEVPKTAEPAAPLADLAPSAEATPSTPEVKLPAPGTDEAVVHPAPPEAPAVAPAPPTPAVEAPKVEASKVEEAPAGNEGKGGAEAEAKPLPPTAPEPASAAKPKETPAAAEGEPPPASLASPPAASSPSGEKEKLGEKPVRKTEAELPADGPVTGEALRRVREARGLTLKDLEAKTKIGHWHLDAIEREKFAGLPALVYLRGFLMSLARELKLDPVRVSKSYVEHMKAKQAEQQPEKP